MDINASTSSARMNSCSFLTFIYFLQNQLGQGYNEYWYRPVLFSRNEGCTLVVLQGGILWIIEH